MTLDKKSQHTRDKCKNINTIKSKHNKKRNRLAYSFGLDDADGDGYTPGSACDPAKPL